MSVEEGKLRRRRTDKTEISREPTVPTGRKITKKMCLVFFLLTALWMSSQGETRAEDPRPSCPSLGFVWKNGTCTFDPLHPDANTDFSSLKSTEGTRHKRQALQGACPYCAQGVFMIYPNWNDCRRYYLCINGVSFDVGCTDGGGNALWYNPSTLQCEITPTLSNSCLFRSYNLLTAPQG